MWAAPKTTTGELISVKVMLMYHQLIKSSNANKIPAAYERIATEDFTCIKTLHDRISGCLKSCKTFH